MIGGIVIEIGQSYDGRQRIVVADRRRGGGLDLHNATGIWVREHDFNVEVGDAVWWQSRYAFWSSERQRVHGVSLKRIGSSFAVRVGRVVLS